MSPLDVLAGTTGSRRNRPGDPADITTFLGIGSIAATVQYCAAHPAYRHPFPIDGGAIVVNG